VLKSPFFFFSGENNFFLILTGEKRSCQAAEGITVYKVKAPVEKTVKKGYVSSSAFSI